VEETCDDFENVVLTRTTIKCTTYRESLFKTSTPFLRPSFSPSPSSPSPTAYN